jgi:uncharacterized protein with GYD domain
MVTFIMAMSIVPEAKKAHADLAHQLNESLELFSKHSIKVDRIYATLGRYDCLAVFQAPDQTVAFRIASEIAKRGLLDTETWPVIPFEDFSELL